MSRSRVQVSPGFNSAVALGRGCDATVFKAEDYVGGYVHTVDATADGATAAVDIAFPMVWLKRRAG